MKKETKKLVGFEESLLNNYRHYLESLENFATGFHTIHFNNALLLFGYVAILLKNWNPAASSLSGELT